MDDGKVRGILASNITQLIYGATAPLKAWGKYFLLPEEQKRDLGLAAQAFSIYFISLYDVAQLSQHEKLPKIAREARNLDQGDIALQAEIFAKKSEFALKLLCQVPMELQIFVRFCRDTFVHGPLSNYSQDTVKVTFAESNAITSKRISRNDFSNMIAILLQPDGDIGPPLSDAAKLTVAQASWINEIEPLICDPHELRMELLKGPVPFPWQSS